MSGHPQAPPSYDSNNPNSDKEGESTTPHGATLLLGACRTKFEGGTINNVAGHMTTNLPHNGAMPSGGSTAPGKRTSESGKSNSNKGGKPTIPVVHSASMLENARDTVFKEVSFNNVNGDMTIYHIQHGDEGEGSAT